MEGLTPRERELVAIGAAMGSNCVPCIEYHIPAARQAGVTDRQIRSAIRLADKVRQVPAKKVLDAAHALLGEPVDEAPKEVPASCERPAERPPGTGRCCDG